MPGKFVLHPVSNAKIIAGSGVKSQMESKFLESTDFVQLNIVFSAPTIMPGTEHVNICSGSIYQMDNHCQPLNYYYC